QPHAALEQIAPRIRPLGTRAPVAAGVVDVARAMNRLEARRHAQLDEARKIGGIEELNVLDARRQCQRAPRETQLPERVERRTYGTIADRVDRRAESALGRAPDDRGELGG